MILKELYDLARREGLVSDPGFEPKEISYVVVVGKGGRLRAILPNLTPSPDGKGMPKPKRLNVPRADVRSSGVRAQFLWDNAQYVFGVNVDPKKKVAKDKLEACRTAFLARVRESAAGSGDSGLHDVVSFLETLSKEGWSRDGLLTKCQAESVEANANFAFRHDSDPDLLVSDRPAVREWWNRSREEPKGPRTICLVTGEDAPAIDSHPKLKKLPGGQTMGVALVSFNNAAFESYGLERNGNAPIGRPAAEAVATAINRLLDRDYPDPASGEPMPRRRIDIAEDTAVVFWAANVDAPVDLFVGGLDADPNAVKALYEAPQQGRRPVLEDDAPFFALAISGEMARAKVRGWYQTTLGRALSNVKAHFDDIELASGFAEPLPLWRLLNATANLGERKNLEPGLAAATFSAVIEGGAYPRALLQGAVRRARAERDVPAARAALIKAYLVRARRKGLLPASFPEVTPSMDTETANVPYRLGRLFAALEKLQEEALPGANTTIRDRFFGAASATPATVFPRLVRGAQPHLGKVKRAVFFERLIQEIVATVERFPLHLDLEDQGLFALGYYHQRQDFFTKKDDAPTAQ